jgi:Arc/MetJ-type ribon-helix-helix transcriptional regulator
MGENSFPPEIRKWIADRVAEGYADEADYLADLVRRDMAQAGWPETPDEIAWVREKIEEGLASGVSDQDAFEFLAELRAGRHDGAS